jgi:hypothetical protein
MALAACLLVFFMALSVWGAARASYASAAAQWRETVQAVKLQQRAGELLALLAQAESRLTRFETQWKRPVTQAEWTESLSTSAGQHGLRVAALAFDEGKKIPERVSMVVQVTLEGPSRGLRQWLARTDDLPGLSELREARIERLSGAPGRVRAQLRIAVFKPVALAQKVAVR